MFTGLTEEYLELERKAEHKSEYWAGEIFAMAGANRRHNLIVGNVIGELRDRPRPTRCEVYPSDMKVRVSATGLYTYPDATVVCEAPEFEDGHEDVLLNPIPLSGVYNKVNFEDNTSEDSSLVADGTDSVPGSRKRPA